MISKTGIQKLIKEFEAKYKTCNGFTFYYEYPGVFVYYGKNKDVYFTPEWDGEENTVDIQVHSEGVELDSKRIKWEGKLTSEHLFQMVKPYLSSKRIVKKVTKKSSKREPINGTRYLAYYNSKPIHPKSINKDFVLSETIFRKVRALIAENKDDAFMKMQGEFWSPNGEARPLIRSLGLHHTSMEIGDCLYDVDADKMYLCENMGWRLLK